VELIWVIIFGILGIFGAALSKQLTDEIKAWTPWIIERLIRAAVAKLPERERDRLHEEWHSDIQDTPGELGRLVVAVGFLFAALKISHDIGNESRRSNLFYETTKRVLDTATGASMLIVVLPLLFLLWCAIRSDSPGPAFVFDDRVGKDGKLIRIPRFRTRSREVTLERKLNSALLKNFTRVGRAMRALSLDTLPYIISVLRGDLSLVGPMAKSPQYMRFLCEKFPDYQETIGFKPGITGWSQVHFAYHGLDEANFLSDTVIAKMVEYDLYYIKNRNFRMDVSIVAWTLWIGLMRPEKQLS
jgi:lipopolysaccharide/colanic/teichoic acid biosynthesis glycosyltransferase